MWDDLASIDPRFVYQGERTRYIRLYPASDWMTQEIRVTGN